MSSRVDAQSFLLRDYRPADFPRLWKIDQLCFPAGIAYDQAELDSYIHQPNSFTIVAEFGRPAGEHARRIVGFTVAETARELGHVVTVDVLLEARRCGLGSRLMAECEQRMRLVGCRQIYLETAVNNLPAVAMYGKLGYQIVRRIPGYYHNYGLDAYRMRKRV